MAIGPMKFRTPSLNKDAKQEEKQTITINEKTETNQEKTIPTINDSQEKTKEIAENNFSNIPTPFPGNVLTEQETLKRISNTGSSIGVLSFDTLLHAPKHFFDKYDTVAGKLVSEVQRIMSNDGTSRQVLEVQRHPDDPIIRTKAMETVKLAISKYTEGPMGSTTIRDFRDEADRKVINVMVLNEILGYGPLDPLWNEASVTEIICNGPFDIQVEIKGNIKKVPACHFRTADQLQQLISRLYNSINKDITPNFPMEKGRLPDKSRMHAVHQSVCPEGPNFNIRRHSDDYIGPDSLIKWGTANEELMKVLGNYIYDGLSYVIIGGTGTGKTTLLDALTAYIRPDKRCISLEENLEMKPHPDKLFAAPMECVPAKHADSKAGEVTMRDLVRGSLQMRPESIYIGEVSDAAAYDLCQALNTGHDGASTLHANTAQDAMYRLMSLVSQSDLVKETAAFDLISSAFDLVVSVERFPLDGSRKIVQIGEVGDKVVQDEEGNKILPVLPLWKFKTDGEESERLGKVVGTWEKVGELTKKTREKHHLDIKPELTWEQLCDLATIKNRED